MAGPISISVPGADNRNAALENLSLYTGYPFAKLDSTSNVSFQTINLAFAHEPPNPNGTSVVYQRTQVYQFAHGYTYIPSTWFLVSVDGFGSAKGSEGVYLTGGGDFPGYSSSVFIAEVDATNVTFYIDKYYDTSIIDLGAPILIGITASVRSYIFINDLSGTDIPSRP